MYKGDRSHGTERGIVCVFAPRHGMLEGAPMVKRDIAPIQLPLPMPNVERSKTMGLRLQAEILGMPQVCGNLALHAEFRRCESPGGRLLGVPGSGTSPCCPYLPLCFSFFLFLLPSVFVS